MQKKCMVWIWKHQFYLKMSILHTNIHSERTRDHGRYRPLRCTDVERLLLTKRTSLESTAERAESKAEKYSLYLEPQVYTKSKQCGCVNHI